MRIILYSSTLAGGGGISTTTTYEWLIKLGHTLTLCRTMKQLEKAPAADIILHHNIHDLLKVENFAKLHKIPVIVTVNNLITCMNGTHLMWRGQDLTPYTKASFFAGFIYQCSEYRVRPWNEKLFAILSYPARFIMMKRRIAALNRVAGVIAISPTLARLMKDNGVRRDIHISPQPIDDGILKIKRKKHSNTVIFYQGGWEPFKGIDMLIQAFEQANIADAELRIAGEIRPAQKVYTRSYSPSVKILGNQSYDALKKNYESADIFVFPSLWLEPFGRGWAEAVIMGVPVIAFAGRGGASDYLEHNKTGCIVQPSSFALKEALQKIADDKKFAASLSKQEKAFGRKHFLASVVMPKLVLYYQKVLNDQHKLK